MYRLLVLSENYGDSVLMISNCPNKNLLEILKTMYENDENGIDETASEICSRLFSEFDLKELGDTNSSKFDLIVELNGKSVADYKYYNIRAV